MRGRERTDLLRFSMAICHPGCTVPGRVLTGRGDNTILAEARREFLPMPESAA
jgi:hypothetical protein